MCTINDIKDWLEKEKGVKLSFGTISNALAGKGNVRSDNLMIIQNAADYLGYKKPPSALRNKDPKLIICILPSFNNDLHYRFFASLQSEATGAGYSTQLFITNETQTEEVEILRNLAAMQKSAIVTVSCLSDSEHYERQSCKVFFIERMVSPQIGAYVGFDYESAGETISKKINRRNASNVLILTDSCDYSPTSDFIRGFDRNITQYQCLELSNCNEFRVLYEFLMKHEMNSIDAVVTSNPHYAALYKSMGDYFDMDAAVFTIAHTSLLQTADETCFNYALAAENIIESIQNGSRLKTAPYLADAPYPVRKAGERRQSKLRILTMSELSVEHFKKIAPIVKKHTGIEYETEFMSNSGFFDAIGKNVPIPHDIIRVDVSMLDFYCDKLYRPLRSFNRSRFLEELSDDFFTVGNVPYVYPFNPAVMVLQYRSDVFDSHYIQQIYYEKHKRKGMKLDLPSSYDDYDSIARFMTGRGDVPVKYGHAVVSGGPYTRANLFTSRLYDKGGSFFTDDGLMLCAEDSQIALTEYLASFNSSPKTTFWVSTPAELYMYTDCAMTVAYSNHSMALSYRRNLFAQTKFAPAPAALTGGGVIGVGRHTKCEEEAYELIELLASDCLAPGFMSLGIYMPLKSLHANTELTRSIPLLKILPQAFKNGLSRNMRQPGSDTPLDVGRIELSVGRAISDAAEGRLTAEQALRSAQRDIIEHGLARGVI